MLGGVFMTDTDGNIGGQIIVSQDQITGMLFDISKQTDFYTAGAGLALKSKLEGKVIEVRSLAELEELGIKNTGDPTKDLFFGVVHYHVKHFFDMQRTESDEEGKGQLYIMFADCKSDWNAVTTLQNAAGGTIRQIGVYTDQSLWKKADDLGATYTLQLVDALNKQGRMLTENHAPASIFLQANSAVVATTSADEKKVDLAKIPSCMVSARYVTVLLGQERSEAVAKMQKQNKSNTPVGCLGAVLGCVARANVNVSFAWVKEFNLFNEIPAIEMGFGDLADKGGAFTSTLAYESLSRAQLDTLDNKGYVFLMKYPGIANGVFFSKDQTCANSELAVSDFATVARNRTIHKSRRNVRQVLLPFVHSPLKVDPATGLLTSAQITTFNNEVDKVLKLMQDNSEIAGYKIVIDKNQNVLKNDTLYIKYSIVPIGVASRINVVEGFALTNK